MSEQPQQNWKEIKEQKEVETARMIAITAIVSCSVLLLACLGAITLVVVAFLNNAPW